MGDRIRKAWRIAYRGISSQSIVYAWSISQARAQTIRNIRDVSDRTFKEALSEIRYCHRAPESDIILPARHKLADHLDPEVLHCIVHAYGGTGLKAGYRDHFYTHDGDPMPKAAYYHGLFAMHRAPRNFSGSRDMVSYTLTDLGRNVAAGEVETYPRR